jgi:N-methylhydantoinase A
VRAIRGLSSKLGTSVDKATESILRIVNSNMSKALSLVSLERGRDPLEFTLIAFGGSGPVHACDLAEELGVRRIVIPLHPGLFSAFGLLTAELSRTFTQSIHATENVERTFAQLREQARKSLKEEGFTTHQTIEQVDLRYQGQAYEITVPYKKDANLTKLFGREHKKLYGYSSRDTIETVNARLRAIIPTPKVGFAKKSLQSSTLAAPTLSRKMSLLGNWRRVPVYSRMSLSPGVNGKGPCIIEEYDSTTIIGKDWSWTVGPYQEIDLTTISKHVAP